MRAAWLLQASILWLLVLGLTHPGSPAQADEKTFEKAYLALCPGTVEELETLADLCHAAKLYAWRNETYELVLLLDADHTRARKWLKYRRSAAGGWKRGTYKPPRNLREPQAEDAASRRAVGERFTDKVLPLLTRHAKNVPAARRQALLRVLGRFAPEHVDVRKAQGNVRTDDGRWLLVESVGASTVRAALRKQAATALASVRAPPTDRPTAADNKLRLGWTAIYQAPHVRVMGTVTKEELLLAVKRIEACHPTFLTAFPGAQTKVKPMILYLLAGSSDKAAVLKNHPAADDGYRKWAKSLQSSWLPKTSTIWILASDRDLRLEWCSRQVMGNLLWRRFGIRGTPGWAFEGCGLYLSHLIAKQRRTFFVRRTQYGEKGTRKNDLWDRLRLKDTDWREEARKLLASEQAPNLRLLLGKKLNAMNTEDMLASFALCAFLIEGRPATLPKLLEDVGRRKKTSVDVLSAAGLDPDTLGIKLRRWLEETR